MRACLFVALAFSGVLQAREPSLKTVLARAGDYVSSYHLSMTTVIAEERYAQTLVTRTGEGADDTTRRTLVSDFVIVNTDGDQPWMAFRDVLEVDGKPVRDRDNRMQRLFSAGADIDRAMAINRESARYNLGTIVRTINTPTVALDFLLPDTQRRFKFHRSDNRLDGGGGAWEIDFSEREHPTIIRTPGGRDVAVRGSVVIDPSDGRIARTTLTLMGNARDDRRRVRDRAASAHLCARQDDGVVPDGAGNARRGGDLFELPAIRDRCADHPEMTACERLTSPGLVERHG